MENINVIVVHGSNSNEASAFEGGVENTRHWHPWLKEELVQRNILFSGDLYPCDWEPDYETWKNLFEQNPISENTVVIGHSAGCAFLLRYFSETKKKVKKIILVAPYVVDSELTPRLSDLVSFTIDPVMNSYCEEIVVFYSDNDAKYILDSVEKIKNSLSCTLRHIPNKGHFTFGHMKSKEFPELLKEILG